MLVQKHGITYHDKKKATPGFTLYSRNNSDQIWLINMDGDVVHQWQSTGGSTHFNYLRPNGNLFVCERLPDGPKLVAGKGGRLREYDWEGNIVWEHIDHHQHHDGRRLENGNAVYIAWQEFNEKEAKLVKGGLPGTEMNGKIYGEVIREVDENGNIVWEFSNNSPEFLDKYALHPLAPREEYGHANTISPMANGDYLVSYRVLNLIIIIDPKTSKIKWEYQNDDLGGQHDCQELENGNILVFANGWNISNRLNYSQVWEIDRETKEIVWRYFPKKNPLSFWSPHISGCQRLHSGNTLIAEGGKGCIFEVTPDGEVVWEYINPFYGPHPALPGEINWVFRAKRYTAESSEIGGRV
ncbi:MAG: arylsulfotransferase family protein [Pseudomonadota bacterium]|nr:arylsulfotransferase family protein [Pseudomonadota bacterium]